MYRTAQPFIDLIARERLWDVFWMCIAALVGWWLIHRTIRHAQTVRPPNWRPGHWIAAEVVAMVLLVCVSGGILWIAWTENVLPVGRDARSVYAASVHALYWRTSRAAAIVTFAAAALSLIALLSLRAAKTTRGGVAFTGYCRQCGYDLRASKDRCSECGIAFDPSAPRQPDAYLVGADLWWCLLIAASFLELGVGWLAYSLAKEASAG